jgi:MFS transporter, DHA1 family, staphyloferrin A biosynthesis exporter
VRSHASRTESPAFRQFHLGFFACRVGEWHYLLALNWAILVRTESALALGVINACRLIPAFISSLPSGVLADRFDRRRLLSIIYGSLAILTGITGFLVYSQAPLWTIGLAVFLRELSNTAEPPIRNAFLSDMERRDLPRALAINAAVLNFGRVIGPTLAGFILVQWNVGMAFVIGTLGLALGALATVTIQGIEPHCKEKMREKAGMSEALTYIRADRRIKLLVLLMIGPMLLAFPYITMLPVFAKDLMKLDADGLGHLLSLTALGSLFASTTIIGNSKGTLSGLFQVSSLLLFSLSLVAVVLAPNFALAAVAVFLAGASSQAYRTVSRILVQSGVPKELHGRIISIILMDRGLIPLGTVVISWCAQEFGPLSAGLGMGIGSALSTLVIVLFYPEILRLEPLAPDRKAYSIDKLMEARNILPPGPA